MELSVVKSGHKRQQETDSCINSREDTVVSFRAYWVEHPTQHGVLCFVGCSTQYALKLTTVSSLELIQESVSCCLLRLLLTSYFGSSFCGIIIIFWSFFLSHWFFSYSFRFLNLWFLCSWLLGNRFFCPRLPGNRFLCPRLLSNRFLCPRLLSNRFLCSRLLSNRFLLPLNTMRPVSRSRVCALRQGAHVTTGGCRTQQLENAKSVSP